MPYSDWFRRVASGREAGRLRVRRSVLITAVSAALIVIAGVTILLVGPGKTTLWTTSVAASRAAHTVHPAPPLQVTSVTPGSNSRGVNGTSPIQVDFSAPLAAGSALPNVSPSVAGSWKVAGRTATFTPATGFPEDTTVTVSIPSGSAGIQSAAGAKAGAGGNLAAGFTRSFTTAWYSTLRLEQLLAQLGYLPLTWTPSGTPVQSADAAGQLAAAYNAPAAASAGRAGTPPC